jgi:hypothetical protein
MTKGKKRPARPRRAKPDVAKVPLTGKTAVVPWKDRPPDRSRSPKGIPPRRPAPPVPRGESVADDDASPPVDIEEPSD